MNTPVSDSNLPSNKTREELECEKLELEIRHLGSPFYKRFTVWIAVIPLLGAAIASTISYFQQVAEVKTLTAKNEILQKEYDDRVTEVKKLTNETIQLQRQKVNDEIQLAKIRDLISENRSQLSESRHKNTTLMLSESEANRKAEIAKQDYEEESLKLNKASLILKSVKTDTFHLQSKLSKVKEIFDLGGSVAFESAQRKKKTNLRAAQYDRFTSEFIHTTDEPDLDVASIKVVGVYFSESSGLDDTKLWSVKQILPSFSDLRTLKLNSVTITGREQLTDVPLTELSFYGSALETLMCVQKLDTLRNLNLRNCKSLSGAEEFEYLTGLDNLTVLWLGNTLVSNQGLTHIGKIKSLEDLDLTHAGIDDDGLPSLSTLTNLKDLNLKGCSIYGHGLKSLTEIASLRQLSLADTPLNDFTQLAQLSNIEELYLNRLKPQSDVGSPQRIINYREIEALSNLTSLKRLSLAGLDLTQCEDWLIWMVTSRKQIEFLDLSGSRLSEETIKTLFKDRPDIRISRELGTGVAPTPSPTSDPSA